MGEQAAAVLWVLARPKAAFLSLPSTRLYALAFLSPLYFGLARAFHPQRHAVLRQQLGGDAQIVIFAVLIALVMIPLGAWIVQRVVKLWKKQLSVIKLMNIYGYALVPRLVVAGIGYLIILPNPSVLDAERPSGDLIALAVLGIAAILYSLALYVYGIAVCPSEG